MNEHGTTGRLDEWLQSPTGRWIEILIIAALLPNPALLGMPGGRIVFGMNPYAFLGLLLLAVWWGYRVWGLRRHGHLRAFLKRMVGMLLLLLLANALMYLLHGLVLWLLDTTGAGTSIAHRFPGIAGGIVFGLLWLYAFYLVGYLLVFGLLWLAWRWLERDRLAFSDSLRWNLLAMAGWGVLAALLWGAALAGIWFTPPGSPQTGSVEQMQLRFHWVRFADGRQGLYGRLPATLPWHDDPEHGMVVHHALLDCGPKGNLRPINDCPVMAPDVLVEPDGLVLLRPGDLVMRDGQPPQRVWLRTEIRHPDGSREQRFVLVMTDTVAPGLKVIGIEPVIRGDRSDSGLRIRLRFHTPVRRDQRLGVWLMPAGQDALFRIPDGKGRVTSLAGMAETMPPLKPRLPTTRRMEQVSWLDGEVDFLYPMSPMLLKNLLRHGDRRYGHEVPALLRVTAVAFGAERNRVSAWNRKITVHLPAQEDAS